LKPAPGKSFITPYLKKKKKSHRKRAHKVELIRWESTYLASVRP
jgi:hypothetical protein